MFIGRARRSHFFRKAEFSNSRILGYLLHSCIPSYHFIGCTILCIQRYSQGNREKLDTQYPMPDSYKNRRLAPLRKCKSNYFSSYGLQPG
jgi:hypothetical protein